MNICVAGYKHNSFKIYLAAQETQLIWIDFEVSMLLTQYSMQHENTYHMKNTLKALTNWNLPVPSSTFSTSMTSVLMRPLNMYCGPLMDFVLLVDFFPDTLSF